MPNTVTRAPRTSLRQRARSSAAMASALRPEPRWPNSSSITYIEPRLGALALRTSDWPEMPTVCATPAVSRASRSMRAITRRVRSTEAASGNCTLSSR